MRKGVKSMDNLYNRFIKTDWIPRIINEMRSKENMIKKELKRLEPVITKENFPEFLSLCLKYDHGPDYGINSIKALHVPTKYFIGATPIMPLQLFESVDLCIPIDDNEIVFNMNSKCSDDYKQDIRILLNNCVFGYKFEMHGYNNDDVNFNYHSHKYNIANIINRYENIFSNFYDIIKINCVLKDNIFNIPIDRFININTKFEKLIMKYIKQQLNKNVLEGIKRRCIDTVLSEEVGYRPKCVESVLYFRSVIHRCLTYDDRTNSIINDFILENLTIDFFAESEEYKIKLESELKIIQSNIVSLETYTPLRGYT